MTNEQLEFEGMIENGNDNGSDTGPTYHEDDAPDQPIFSLQSYSNAPVFDAEDILIPRIRLAQGLTNEVQAGTAKPGQWIVTGFEPADEITIVPLLASRQRRLTDEDFQTLCQSSDGVTGVGTPGGACSKCPKNQWTDGPKGRRNPPACTFSYAFVVYVVDFETMAIVEFRRTGIQAGKTLNTNVMRFGLGRFAAILRSGAKQGPRGAYYTATVVPTKVTEEILSQAREFLS